MEPLTVACVLRSGGIYTPAHVEALMKQVGHFMPDTRFVCISDVQVPCERVVMRRDWPGWWSKIELFEHFRGRTLYFDLDSVLLADASSLACGEQFRMVRNWKVPHLMSSCVMYWNGDYSHIARMFERAASYVMSTYVTCEQWGDQAFIAEHAGNVEPFPGQIESWLCSLNQRPTLPRSATVVAFNGNAPPWRGPWWAKRWYE